MVESAVREDTNQPAAKKVDLYAWARRQAELLRAGRLSDAKVAARRYLANYRDGAHHAQARRIAGD